MKKSRPNGRSRRYKRHISELKGFASDVVQIIEGVIPELSRDKQEAVRASIKAVAQKWRRNQPQEEQQS